MCIIIVLFLFHCYFPSWFCCFSISGLFSAFLVTVCVITFDRGGLNDDRLFDPPASHQHSSHGPWERTISNANGQWTLSRTLLQKFTHFSSNRRFVCFFLYNFFLLLSCSSFTIVYLLRETYSERERKISRRCFNRFSFAFISISFSDHLWDLWAWARPFYGVQKGPHRSFLQVLHRRSFFLLFSSSFLRPFFYDSCVRSW